jgi:hypothetical protein
MHGLLEDIKNPIYRRVEALCHASVGWFFLAFINPFLKIIGTTKEVPNKKV